ncbi:hypothetical protein AAHH78_35095, partial [Burkholderia pseudomallei]
MTKTKMMTYRRHSENAPTNYEKKHNQTNQPNHQKAHKPTGGQQDKPILTPHYTPPHKTTPQPARQSKKN